MKSRNFLFLQGSTSPFFSKLGDALIQAKAHVFRINFNAGDYTYWRNKPSWQFRDKASVLPEYLRKKVLDYGITDIIMLGDTRPVNAAAVPLAKALGLRLHIFDEGYLRPDWLTLEEGGINGFSQLPKEANWYLEVAKHLPPAPPSQSISNPITLLALHEIGYHFPGLLNPIFYHGYKTHRPAISGLELAGWGIRFSQMPWYETRDKRTIHYLLSNNKPFYLLPLQLDSDSQIQVHSDITSMSDLIRTIVDSFSEYAPEESLLVIKNHPLDTGFTNFSKIIRQLSKEKNIEGRILYLESGSLPALLDACEGVVVVNSTVGITALAHQCRTLALGQAIYDMPGLTAQCSLNAFWHDTTYPNTQLFDAFKKIVIHATQINGGFFSSDGIRIGVNNAMKRLQESQSPLDALLESYPVSPS
jgi:capsular polysaccharide export protein